VRNTSGAGAEGEGGGVQAKGRVNTHTKKAGGGPQFFYVFRCLCR
jgi:hypothetical protein